jgi:MtfA peptidase
VLRWLRNWWQRKFGPAEPLDVATWDDAFCRVRGTRHLSAAEVPRLRALVREFLHEKQFVAAEGFALADRHRFAIAIQACVPILHLGLEAYRGFRTIYVFPHVFRERGQGEWRPGQYAGALAGLAIRGGGVALAWSESWRGFDDDSDGYNPIIHEFAHQLDMITGAADGRPPLPPGVTPGEWCGAFSRAFHDFRERVHDRKPTGLSDYAATNPGEFFAVLSEVHFEEPEVIQGEYPEVARLLRAFYSQRPRA